jgi:hypothetical protein
MSKLKAAGIHFVISVSVITLFLLFVYFIWYDRIFAGLAGVINPIKVLVLVDAVLGPLLTFIVYKAGKKSLKMDLTLIVVVQLLAFIYGAYTLYMGKPTLVVLKDNVFEVVIQNQTEPEQWPDAAELPINTWLSPVYVKVDEQQVNVFNSAVSQQNLLKTLDFNQQAVKDKSLSLKHVLNNISADEAQLRDELQIDDLSTLQFYLVVDGQQYAVLVVSAGEPVAVYLTDELILNVGADY